VEDEEEMFGPYGQGLVEDSENSDHPEAAIMQEQQIQVVEASSESPPTPEQAPSTSAKSTVEAPVGLSADGVQLLMQMLQSFQQEYKADKTEIVEMLSQKLEYNQQKQEEKDRLNQQRQEQLLQKHSQVIREEIKVQDAEINKVKEKCDKNFEKL
jgi:hypothetical protein